MGVVFFKLRDVHHVRLSFLKNYWCHMTWFTKLTTKALETTPTRGSGCLLLGSPLEPPFLAEEIFVSHVTLCLNIQEIAESHTPNHTHWLCDLLTILVTANTSVNFLDFEILNLTKI